jgi:hypothetical protein
MSQHQSTGSAGPVSPNFAAICTKGAETFGAIQKEWLETLQHAHRDWVGWLEAETKLGSDFAAKVTAAKAFPDAAAACQEWMSRRAELLSKEWQKVGEESQKFVKACTRIAANGRGAGLT